MIITDSSVSSPTPGTKPSELMWKWNVEPLACSAASRTDVSNGASAATPSRIDGTPTDGRMVQSRARRGTRRVRTSSGGTR